MYGNRKHMRTAFIERYQWIALFESNQQCANTHTKRDHTNTGFRRVLLVSIYFPFMFAYVYLCTELPNVCFRFDGIWGEHMSDSWITFCWRSFRSMVRYRTNWMQSIRIGHWWCNMDKFRLAPMATGVVFGDRMDNCILLFIKRHQKCWQSGLLHCTFPICYVDGTSGKASHRAYCRQPKLDPKRFQCVFCRYVV